MHGVARGDYWRAEADARTGCPGVAPDTICRFRITGVPLTMTWTMPVETLVRARIFHHLHADRNVSDADAVVNGRPFAALVVPAIDVGRSDLELQRGRHAVSGVSFVVGRGLPVLMEIDEARRHDEPAGVKRLAAFEDHEIGGAAARCLPANRNARAE